MALGSTHPLREMSTRNRPRGKGRLARQADHLTAICEPTVYKMWEPRRLTILGASMACYRNSLPLPFLHSKKITVYQSEVYRQLPVGAEENYEKHRKIGVPGEIRTSTCHMRARSVIT
jgi:hypothetical protein